MSAADSLSGVRAVAGMLRGKTKQYHIPAARGASISIARQKRGTFAVAIDAPVIEWSGVAPFVTFDESQFRVFAAAVNALAAEIAR